MFTFENYYPSLRDFFIDYTTLREKVVSTDISQLPTHYDTLNFFQAWTHLRRHPSELNSIPARNAFKDVEVDIPDIYQILSMADAIRNTDFDDTDFAPTQRDRLIAKIKWFGHLLKPEENIITADTLAAKYELLTRPLIPGIPDEEADVQKLFLDMADGLDVELNRQHFFYPPGLDELEKMVAERADGLRRLLAASRDNLVLRPVARSIGFFLATTADNAPKLQGSTEFNC